MNEKEITIKVPEGKRAEWINGVLTLVDEPKVDNRPVTERIKTFEDALDELEVRAANGDNTAKMLFDDWHYVTTDSDDLIAYLKLRIITAALNEGWEPDWTNDEENKYFSCFCIYTEEECSNLYDDDKEICCRVVGRSNSSAYAYYGSRLSFKTRELALYAGKQFIELWCDFVFNPRSYE